MCVKIKKKEIAQQILNSQKLLLHGSYFCFRITNTFEY